MDGRLDIAEFKELWKDLHKWKEAFVRHDVERKGYFLAEEFENIIRELGEITFCCIINTVVAKSFRRPRVFPLTPMVNESCKIKRCGSKMHQII